MDTSVTVVYETIEEAQQAIEQLNNYDYQGSILRAEFGNSPSASRGPNTNAEDTISSPHLYTLRILVPDEFIGAIIGRRGQMIHEITNDSKTARIDVIGRDNPSLLEKIISISGTPESVSRACREILYVMELDSVSNIRACEVMLKLLADDCYCGRVIGKEGRVIKKIREDTNTHIIVSSMQEAPAIFPDRLIAIRGTVENMSAAEAAISTLLRECAEKNNMQSSSVSGSLSQGRLSRDAATEVYQIFIPSSAVGVIIGTGGSNIKQIIRNSGAFCSINPRKEPDMDQSTERIITIKGSPDSCWKASYCIYETMKVEGFAGYNDVRLKTAVKVPRSLFGHLIGKGGRTIREIQHSTGSIVKLPTEVDDICEETFVQVYGNFLSTQSAYNRIRSVLSYARDSPTRPGVICHSEPSVIPQLSTQHGH